MERIVSLEQYNQIIADYKQGRTSFKTNNFMMPDEVEERLNRGALSYRQDQDTLWLFYATGDYSIGYYMCPKEAVPSYSGLDHNLLVELVGSSIRYDQTTEDALVRQGFAARNTNLEFRVGADELAARISKELVRLGRFVASIGFRVEPARAEDYDDLFKLWSDNIDRYAVRPLTEGEKDSLFTEGRCILVRDTGSKIMACQPFRISGNIALMEHLVSLNKGSGMGAVALYYGLDAALKKGCKGVRFWIWEDNAQSLSLISRLAQPTGKFSKQMIFE